MSQVFDNLANDPTVGAIGLALGLAAAGLWVAAAWWTYTDMGRRTTFELARLGASAWILLSTPLLLPLALATYVLARPQQTVAERRAQRLFEAMAPAIEDGECPGCGAVADPAWHRCPRCTTWLAASCGACGEWSGVDLELCPYCAHDRAATAATSGASPLVAAAPIATTPRVAELPSDGMAGAGEAQPTPRPVALTIHPDRAGNRGARDRRRARGADRTAGSTQIGVGS
jgi:hypothetical protein